MKTKVAIIGAGPAGLFAARELIEKGIECLIIEEGKEALERECPVPDRDLCLECDPCQITSGVGGAGALSDGKLNLTYKIGGSPARLKRKPEEIQKFINYVDSVFLNYGVDDSTYGVDGEQMEALQRKASKSGIEFIPGKQRHIGSDNTKKVVDNFYRDLKSKGVGFLLKTKIASIEEYKDSFLLRSDNEDITAGYVIAAPGRAGAYWLRSQAYSLGVVSRYGPIDVGVRVEFPSTIYKPICKTMYDAKFKLYTRTYDDMVRTFCTNPEGFVTEEKYDGFVLVNGHAKKEEKSENTNLAILTRIHLTDPVEDTTRYGRSIAKLATTIGGGKPILQRYKDFIKGRRSTWKRIDKSPVNPTLRSVTPGDLSMAMPYRIVYNTKEAIERFNSVIEGIASDSTLLYGPEIKFYDTKYATTKFMETNLNNMYICGDASGRSRGIIYAAVSGVLAARGILRKEGH
ncbi:MAG: NAD(P)/FAD-dependent oxidoreductase [Euryarchaeota archaeon]|nr:NAD(P)/FAD-dependent oxidoreductase [Euryarchaeota archaeon]